MSEIVEAHACTDIHYVQLSESPFSPPIPSTAFIDYTPTTMQLTFLPASTEECAVILVTPDTFLENSEEFTVQLSTPDQDVTLVISSAIVTIIDDDSELVYYMQCHYMIPTCFRFRSAFSPVGYTAVILIYTSGVTVGLEQTSYSVGEGNGSLSVCAVLIGMAQRNVSVILSILQGTAQGNFNNK